MIKNDLTQERLKELLSYDPETGMFVWVKSEKGIKIGEMAGCNHSRGYLRIRIDGKDFFSHRLAWFYMVGAFPSDQTDHINRIKTDNRFINLRAVTTSENQHNRGKTQNNNSGHKGVNYDKSRKKWFAQIGVNRIRHFLGRFPTSEDASAAYLVAQRIYHPTAPIFLQEKTE